MKVREQKEVATIKTWEVVHVECDSCGKRAPMVEGYSEHRSGKGPVADLSHWTRTDTYPDGYTQNEVYKVTERACEVCPDCWPLVLGFLDQRRTGGQNTQAQVTP